MSLCLSGGRAYGGVDLEIIKPPSPTTSSTRTTSSPSSTLSESSNSRLAICTRKPRTARKRPNQTYNEAAALLSTAYPAIFSTKQLPKKPQKFTKQPHESFFDQSSELLLPFPVIDSPGFLLHGNQIPSFRIDPKPHETDSSQAPQYEDDFDTESILDEEIEEGIIDSIMGISTDKAAEGGAEMYCNPMGLGRFDFGFGIRRGVRPMRNADDGNWRFSTTVDVLEISPRLKKPTSPPAPPPPTTLDKKKKKAEGLISNQPLHLKLDFEEVVKAWSGRPLPLPEELAAETDVSARLAQIDLFTESGGLREASVMRYKEKRRTRLFSKKIRYQVRKVNADRRPRMKGRFVRRSNSNAITRDEKSQTRKGRQGVGFGFGL